MGDHIKIDTGLLADMGTQLGKLRDEFTNATKSVDGYGGDMGSGDVADAMHDFASDWDKKKGDITAQLDTLSKGATGSAKVWDGVDGHLADAIIKSMSSDGGSRHEPR